LPGTLAGGYNNTGKRGYTPLLIPCAPQHPGMTVELSSADFITGLSTLGAMPSTSQLTDAGINLSRGNSVVA